MIQGVSVAHVELATLSATGTITNQDTSRTRVGGIDSGVRQRPWLRGMGGCALVAMSLGPRRRERKLYLFRAESCLLYSARAQSREHKDLDNEKKRTRVDFFSYSLLNKIQFFQH